MDAKPSLIGIVTGASRAFWFCGGASGCRVPKFP